MSISRHLSFTRTAIAALLTTSLSVGLTGCGGGGSGGDNSGGTAISGSVFAAPVSGAGCEIRNSSGITVADSITTTIDPGALAFSYLRGKWEDQRCPAGGVYTINPVGKNPTCSMKGHALPVFP